MSKQYIKGWLDTEAGRVPGISADLDIQDKLGALKVRFSIGRMNYAIEPGIYALGNPAPGSNVFVCANYKLSFDALRRELKAIDAWLLALDTKGINVWCAAGKGTFGTKELVNRIKLTGLEKVVNHRKLIVPQLGATGVSAHEVKKQSGFSVIYGPVRAHDIPAFLKAGLRSSPELRKVKFPFYNRLELVPLELVGGAKYLIFSLAVVCLLAGFSKSGYSSSLALETGARSMANLLFAYIAGTVIGPLFLPWIPGRSFALKGFLIGMVLFIVSYSIKFTGSSAIEIISWMLIMPALASFILMNFTGSSTYTSLSGVKKEMSVAVPLQVAVVAGGVLLGIINKFV